MWLQSRTDGRYDIARHIWRGRLDRTSHGLVAGVLRMYCRDVKIDVRRSAAEPGVTAPAPAPAPVDSGSPRDQRAALQRLQSAVGHQPAVPWRRPFSAARGRLQRVTYKNTDYDPFDPLQQSVFVVVGTVDLKAAGKWTEGRSNRLLGVIGRTSDSLADVDALADTERSLWESFAPAIEKDISGLDADLKLLRTQAEWLEAHLADLRTQDEPAVHAALKVIDTLVKKPLLPQKWRHPQATQLPLHVVAVKKFVDLQPWTTPSRETLQSQHEEKLKVIKQEDDKALRREDDRYKKALAKGPDALDKAETAAVAAARNLKGVPDAVAAPLRASAAEQYERGTTGYRYTKSITPSSTATRSKKLYIGQIEDTKKLVRKGDKGKGVLWAAPWAPGVNAGFIAGGLAANAVFKLKSDVPADLAGHLEAGEIDGFRNAAEVAGRAAPDDKTYWPFWQGVEQRSTLFTEELTTLMESGYRLRTFNRKAKGSLAVSPQQLMATEAQMKWLAEFYTGR